MSLSRSRQGAALTGLFKLIGGVLLGAGFLFLHAWLPIQAERSRRALETVERDIFRKKAEIQNLNGRYVRLASLPVLDQWAKRHGPWVPPNADNVIAIHH